MRAPFTSILPIPTSTSNISGLHRWIMPCYLSLCQVFSGSSEKKEDMKSLSWRRFLMATNKKKSKRMKKSKVVTTTKDDVDAITRYSDIPSSLVIDILLRLPIETLLTCRRVFKDWIPLFSDPYFIKLQFAASPVHMLDSILRNDRILRFGLVTEDKDSGELEPKIVNFYAKLNLPRSLDIINSCNGLLCLIQSGYECIGTYATNVYVCNPLLGEWVSIPNPVENHSYLSTAALVFSAKNNQYKVFHSCYDNFLKRDRFDIYTFDGTRQWRSIDESLGCGLWYKHSEEFRINLIFVHGSLHWTDRWGYGVRDKSFISCFDVDNEKFRRLSMPRPGQCGEHVQLGAINGCLSALYIRYVQYDGEIWAMKEYGVEKSWTRILIIREKFIIKYPELLIYRGRLFDPVVLSTLNEDDIVIQDDCHGFLRYDLKRDRNRNKSFEAYAQWCSEFISMTEYKPSFVSLQEVAKGEEVMLSR